MNSFKIIFFLILIGNSAFTQNSHPLDIQNFQSQINPALIYLDSNKIQLAAVGNTKLSKESIISNQTLFSAQFNQGDYNFGLAYNHSTNQNIIFSCNKAFYSNASKIVLGAGLNQYITKPNQADSSTIDKGSRSIATTLGFGAIFVNNNLELGIGMMDIFPYSSSRKLNFQANYVFHISSDIRLTPSIALITNTTSIDQIMTLKLNHQYFDVGLGKRNDQIIYLLAVHLQKLDLIYNFGQKSDNLSFTPPNHHEIGLKLRIHRNSPRTS
jgi:hypothetical protein